MRTETQTIRIGENMGPIDWTHNIAKDKPQTWREAEASPDAFTFNGRPIFSVAMYDGWPYWTPRPAIQFCGPLGPEWTFFDSYAVYDGSIQSKQETAP